MALYRIVSSAIVFRFVENELEDRHNIKPYVHRGNYGLIGTHNTATFIIIYIKFYILSSRYT